MIVSREALQQLIQEMREVADMHRSGSLLLPVGVCSTVEEWANRLALMADVLGSPTSQDQNDQGDTRVDHTQYDQPLATAASHVLVPRTLIATTLVESERQIALRWREAFLNDEGPGTVSPLDPQLVAYLIEDGETLQKIAAASAEVVSPQPTDALVAENRRLRSILAIEEARHRAKNHTNGGLNPIGFSDNRCEVCNRFKAALNDGRAAEVVSQPPQEKCK